jgi:hypothetical protein
MEHRTVTTTDIWKKKRDDLNTERNLLFKQYSQTPDNIDLAVRIKKIDDEIAECTDRMSQERLAGRKSKSLLGL